MRGVANTFETMWNHVIKGPSCWEWQGYKNHDGYGRFRVRRVTYSAHRIAYQLSVGEIPEGMCVCHQCDNRGCVNPQHLFLGTSAENMQDKMNKNRQTRGELNPRSKLTTPQVKVIKYLLRHGVGITRREMARMFGVSMGKINQIAWGQSWTHGSEDLTELT